MNEPEMEYIKELMHDKSRGNRYEDENLGKIKLLIVYRGEGLFFQINGKAFICAISAGDEMLSKQSLKKWNDGSEITTFEREKLIPIILRYYQKAYKDILTVV